MSKVYFLKDFTKLASATKEVLQGFYSTGSKTLVKIHFGEPGNEFALTSDDVKPIIEAMKSLGLEPIFIDTLVAYNSPRNSIKGHEEVVRQRGYDKLASFLISDNGIDIKTKNFTAQVCKELVEAENVLVISHVKGHECSGFGGAVKNLGMGGVTKETKSLEHALSKAVFVKECQGCGICVDICPGKAIKMVSNKAEIDLNSCFGCSICQVNCPHSCLAPKTANFDDVLGQGAAAVINNLPQKTFYINLVNKIAKWCDCEKNPRGVISKDVGVLFSDDPISIDKASVDLINKLNGRDIFKEENHKDPLLHVKFAAEYANKSMDYQLIEI